MFGSSQIQPQSPPARDAMNQQQPSRRASMASATSVEADQIGWLQAETLGRDRFRQLLQRWLKRNQWSLAVVSRLAELSLLATSQQPIPDWAAGMPLSDGAWVNHRGHAWQALGNPLSEPTEGDPGWQELGLTSRLHASGLNLFLRNQTRTLTATFILELGRLNQWVADVQSGRCPAPVDRRLRDLVKGAMVIRDEHGALGPEELLGIAVGRLQPPPWPEELAPPEQAEPSVPARQLRAAAAGAGLDIVDDWQTIASLYPSADPARLERLQHVLRGISQWSDEQEEDERAACLILLQRLERYGKNSGEPTDVDSAIVMDISTEAR